jgi:1-acyl-sn-glycerol-3-phosphate acyltransferase
VSGPPRVRGWARSPVAGAAREAILGGLLGPLIGLYTRRRIAGRANLAGLDGPVVFVANHSSHMDTPTILRALPARWRRRTAVAAAADYFYRRPLLADVVSLAFNTVPVQRDGHGAAEATQLERLLDEGWSLLVYAEGTRSRDGTVGRLHSGAAVLAAAHRVPIVPVYVSGTHDVMPPGRGWMRRRPARPLPARQPIGVHFGAAIVTGGGEHRTEVMERVRQFFATCGAVTTPDKRIAARTRSSGLRLPAS